MEGDFKLKNETTSTKNGIRRAALYKLGIGLLIFSLALYLIPVVTPFTPLPIKIKAGLMTGSIIIAEVSFWIGALLVGKEVASKFKGYMNPKNWKKRKRRDHEV